LFVLTASVEHYKPYNFLEYRSDPHTFKIDSKSLQIDYDHCAACNHLGISREQHVSVQNRDKLSWPCEKP